MRNVLLRRRNEKESKTRGRIIEVEQKPGQNSKEKRTEAPATTTTGEN